MDDKQRKCLSCGNTEFLRPIHYFDAEGWRVVPEDRAKWKDPIHADVEFDIVICASCGLSQVYAANLEELNRVRKSR